MALSGNHPLPLASQKGFRFYKSLAPQEQGFCIYSQRESVDSCRALKHSTFARSMIFVDKLGNCEYLIHQIPCSQRSVLCTESTRSHADGSQTFQALVSRLRGTRCFWDRGCRARRVGMANRHSPVVHCAAALSSNGVWGRCRYGAEGFCMIFVDKLGNCEYLISGSSHLPGCSSRCSRAGHPSDLSGAVLRQRTEASVAISKPYLVRYPDGSSRHVSRDERDSLLASNLVRKTSERRYRYTGEAHTFHSLADLAKLSFAPLQSAKRFVHGYFVFDLKGRKRRERMETPEGLAIRLNSQLT